MSAQIKLTAPLGGSDVATVTPEPSPVSTTPVAKIVGPISSLTDTAPLASGDVGKSTKKVAPLSDYEH